MTEPTPKPTDALDLLKKLAGGVDPEKCSPFQAMAREWAIEAAEAWEKERAEHELRRGALMRSAELNGEKTGELIALRAALERIEGEMNVHVESEWATKPRHESDRLWVRVGIVEKWMHELRAAREGGK